jgi:hypothetical protein
MVYNWSLAGYEELFESQYFQSNKDGSISPLFTKGDVSKLWARLSFGSESHWVYDFNTGEFVVSGVALDGEPFEFTYGAVYDNYFGAWVYPGLKEFSFVLYRGKVV